MRESNLIIGITAPVSVNLIRGQAKFFSENGYRTFLLAPNHPLTIEYCDNENCTLLPVNIRRDISIISDFKALITVFIHFFRVRPDVVNVGTPKMGLLGMLAAWILRIKKRVYTCRGFRYEHESGRKRKILMFMERLSGICAQEVVCISPSVKELGVRDAVFNEKKCRVIHNGSSNGINRLKFDPSKVPDEKRSEVTDQLGIKDSFVYGYVGRLIDRKGIAELYQAFSLVYDKDLDVRLLIIGPLEFDQISDNLLVDKLKAHPGIIMPGRTDDVPLYLSVMDVFVLPAWWEGFGNVLIEAACMGIPVISTKGTGTRDAVNDGFNGILVDVGNVDQLVEAMLNLKNNESKRIEMGRNGMEWAKNFDNKVIWNGLLELYQT